MNSEVQLAEEYALHTSENLFITGHAGTGKTTLLRKIASEKIKNTVVAAPTGVAAIQAGGVTLHSLFQLPVTSFIPSNDNCDPHLFTNQHQLIRHIRYSKEKINLIRETEMMIIDEASMVRSDLLDAVDFVLRSIRKNNHPFGGIQVVLFGDLFQLPPVVKDPEWEVLSAWYRSPYFFDSLVWPDARPVHIELVEIYRQQDQRFIQLLNNIRNRIPSDDDIRLLEERYQPGYESSDDLFILLTTHNFRADRINEERMRQLDAQMFTFHASTEGEFPEHLYPCEQVLNLKQGARIMFIKNDHADGLYYNGLTGTVIFINEKQLIVKSDDGREIEVKRRTWENIRYRTSHETGMISKEVIGTFRQFPVRLAWAVTIHKSQGLTFDKVMIDAAASFAPGQVYVALSRCRSLDGIVLLSRIHRDALFSDARVLDFTRFEFPQNNNRQRLHEARLQFSKQQLINRFRVDKLQDALEEWTASFQSASFKAFEEADKLSHQSAQSLSAAGEVASRFIVQLEKIIPAALHDISCKNLLRERCIKAIDYFTTTLHSELILPFNAYISMLAYKTGVKKHVAAAIRFTDQCWNHINRLYDTAFLGEKMYTDVRKVNRQEPVAVATSNTKRKKVKGDSINDTLTLHKQKKSISEIAEIRSLATSTIKGHLAALIKMNKVDLYEVLSEDRIRQIKKLIDKNKGLGLSAIRQMLPAGIDLNDVRMVLNYAESGKPFRS